MFPSPLLGRNPRLMDLGQLITKHLPYVTDRESSPDCSRMEET